MKTLYVCNGGSRRRQACTCVDEAARRSFAELFGLVGEGDLHDPGDVSWGRLHPDGMGRDELKNIREHVRHIPLDTHIDHTHTTHPRDSTLTPDPKGIRTAALTAGLMAS